MIVAQAVNDEDVQHYRRGAQHAEAQEQPGQTVLVSRAGRVATPVAQHERGQQRERGAGDEIDPDADPGNGHGDARCRGDGKRGRNRGRVQGRDGDRSPGRGTRTGARGRVSRRHRHIVARPGLLRHGRVVTR